MLTRLARPALLILAAALSGCTATFSADLRNQTPQPVFAQIVQRTDDERRPILASLRLGPGDRATIGPVRTNIGRAILSLDTLPNPQGAYTTDLRPGLTTFTISQKGDKAAGPLEIREISSSPP